MSAKETMFKAVEATIAGVGEGCAEAVELVAIVKRVDGAGTLVANVATIDEVIDRLRFALILAEEAKRQLDGGVAHYGDAPPTAH